MFNLDRHIEILLLKHNCVVVPGFGGFVVHHVSARFDERDGMMLPPIYTVGFNQQLVVNDSLLVQSYVDAYEMSYPEALREIESETAELRATIADNGYFDIHNIGCLTLNESGNYAFEPCEAGILRPSLYGLSGIETFSEEVRVKSEDGRGKSEEVRVKSEDDGFIHISKATINNAIIACAAVALLLIIPLAQHFKGSNEILSSIDTSFITNLFPSETQMGKKPLTNPTLKREGVMKSEKASIPVSPQEKEISVAKDEPKEFYTVVLAARISSSNAEDYVKKLSSHGIKAQVYGEGKSRKVICGSYTSEEEAQKHKRELATQEEFASVWVTTVKL